MSTMTCLDDFEAHAQRHLPKYAYDYYARGADQEQTLRDNIAAYRRLRLYPELLKDVSNRDLTTTILGSEISFPVAIAPTGMHKMAHPEGEVATAKAAASMDTVMALSSGSTRTIEEVAQAAPDGLRWFQIYVYKDRAVTMDLVERAERSGYRALVVTVDTPHLGKRRADVENKFAFPYKLVNFELPSQSDVIGNAGDSGLAQYVASMFDQTLNWDDIDWLRGMTSLPIVIKGILTGKDAAEAVRRGVAGIVVSNHGGRQLDGTLATIDALPEVVEAVQGSNVEVYLDGGIRLGTDVLKALALGARAVFIGRPVLWGLAYNGEQGVKEVLEMLKTEFDLALALSGCTSARSVPRSLVSRHPQYASNL